MKKAIVLAVSLVFLLATASWVIGMVFSEGEPISLAQQADLDGIPYCEESAYPSELSDPMSFLLWQEQAALSPPVTAEKECPPCQDQVHSRDYLMGCFVGETLVRTPLGFKEIRTVRLGDFVLSMNIWRTSDGDGSENSEFGQLCWSKVRGITKHSKESVTLMAVITVNGTIRSTEQHPFFSELGMQYFRAQAIPRRLDLVTSRGLGFPARVIHVSAEAAENMDVFELSLDNPKNFFVYSSAADSGVLVHNYK